MWEFYSLLASFLITLVLNSICKRGLTIRYASLRNSSAVSVDGRRDSGLGMVFAACFSVKRWLMVGVRSGILIVVLGGIELS